MTNVTNAGVISVIFFILSAVKDKYVAKEEKSMKSLLTDSLFVFVSSNLGFFAMEKMDCPTVSSPAPTAFLGKPEF